jgi:hypothetical protein
MKTFKQHNLMEANTGASKQLEYVLVDAAGGNTDAAYGMVTSKAKAYTKAHLEAMGLTEKQYNALTDKEVCIEFGKVLLKNAHKSLTKKKGVNKMTNNVYDTTALWRDSKRPAINKTPKTDIIINSKKISLKNGDSQIMSGAPNEALATFEAACNTLEKSWGDARTIAHRVHDGIEGLMTSQKFGDNWGKLSKDQKRMGGVTTMKYGGDVYANTDKAKTLITKIAGTIKKDKKTLSPAEKTQIFKNPQTADEKELAGLWLGSVSKLEKERGKFEIKFLQDANDLHDTVTKDIAKMFKNDNFKRAFVFEAMTGKAKFGRTDGKATHFLVCDWQGNAAYHKVTKPGAKYVGELLKHVSPDIRFKTGAKKITELGVERKTGYYNFYDVISLYFRQAEATENYINDMVNSGEVEFLSEGFFDFVSRTWNKFKTWGKNLLEKAINWIKKSAVNLVKFFEMEPIVKFPQTVVWPMAKNVAM